MAYELLKWKPYGNIYDPNNQTVLKQSVGKTAVV